MFILVKYHKIHATQASAVSTETFADYDSAVKRLYQLMANNIADTTVEECNIVIMNSGFNILKTEKYTRYYPEVNV